MATAEPKRRGQTTMASDTNTTAPAAAVTKPKAKRASPGPRKGYVLWSIADGEPNIADFTFSSDKAMDWQEAQPGVNKVKRVTVEPQRSASRA